MRVINILEDGRLAGPHKRVLGISAHINESFEGCEVFVLLPIHKTELLNLELEGFEKNYTRNIIMFPLSKRMLHLVRYLFVFPFTIIQIIMQIKMLKPDLIHVSGGIWQVTGVIAAIITKTKFVWHMNDSFQPNIVMKFTEYLRNKCENVIFASEASRKFYEPFFPNASYEVIGSFTDIPTKIKNTYNVGHTFKMITVCNISPVKDIEFLIDVVNEIHQSIPVELEVIGPVHSTQQKYFQQIQAKVRNLGLDCVHFRGHSPDTKKFLERSDLYICSSKYEASPVAVWEAMSVGLPVLSTNVGDLMTYSETSQCLAVIKYRDPKLFAQKAIEIWKNEKLRTELGQGGLQFVSLTKNLKIISEQTMNAYMKIHEKV
ncbi:glycosyltransferase [bacterium]|nr:glycosyltransferase [bacterium]